MKIDNIKQSYALVQELEFVQELLKSYELLHQELSLDAKITIDCRITIDSFKFDPNLQNTRHYNDTRIYKHTLEKEILISDLNSKIDHYKKIERNLLLRIEML